MKDIVFWYIVFCIILVFIFYYYAKKKHEEEKKRTAMLAQHLGVQVPVTHFPVEETPQRVAVKIIPINKNSKFKKPKVKKFAKHKTIKVKK